VENLEKSWNVKMVIFRPGKVLEEKKKIPKVLERSCKYVFMCSFTPSLKNDAVIKSRHTLSFKRYTFSALQVNAP